MGSRRSCTEREEAEREHRHRGGTGGSILSGVHGDLRLGEITREKAREFRDAVAKVPSALPRDLRKLSLPKLLQRDFSGFKPRMATTVNKIVQILGGIVSRAEREGFLDKVPGYLNPFGKAIRFSVDLKRHPEEPG